MTTEIDSSKTAPIELDPELTAALESDEPLTDDLAERIADQIAPRNDDGPRTYGQPSKWVVPIGHTIATYVTRSDIDQLCLTEPTTAAWGAVEAAHDVVQEARADLDSIEAERAVEARAADELVADQVRLGQAAHLPPGVDWDAEQRTRSAVLRVRVEELAKARASYDKVAAAEQPKRRQAALDRIRSTKAAADKLVPAACAAFVAYRQAVDEGTELFAALEGPRGQVERYRNKLTDQARRTQRDGQAAPAAMKALLQSDHPILAGTYLNDRGDIDPPLFAREAVAHGRSEGDFAELCQIEVREDFAVTKYGYQHALATGQIRPPQRRPHGS